MSDIDRRIGEFRRQDRRQKLIFLLLFASFMTAAVAGAWYWFEEERERRRYDLNSPEMLEPPANWNEKAYLKANPDVAKAVRQGRIKSGWQHYITSGVQEGRRGASVAK